MSDTQNEPLPGEKAIKVKKAGPILLGADRYEVLGLVFRVWERLGAPFSLGVVNLAWGLGAFSVCRAHGTRA